MKFHMFGGLTAGALVATMLCASPATAATDGNAPTYDTTINESASSSSSTAAASVTSVNGFSLKAAQRNELVAYVNANGMPDSQQAKAKSITLKKGMTLKTSYVNIYGQEVWHMKFYAKGYTFYLGADGWYHDPECNNKVVVKQSKKRPPKGHIFIKAKVKVVKRFKFSGAASASIHEMAVASSRARSVGFLLDHNGSLMYDKDGNPIINCESGASGSGSAEVSASGSASIKGRVFYTYQSAYSALLEGAANSLELDLKNKGYTKLTVKGEVRASAKGVAESNASAFAWCKNTQLPPPPTPEATYSCDTLNVTKGDNRSVTIAGFSTSQSGGATFKNAVIEWGDGSSETFTSPVGKSHTFGADGTYTIRATAVFDVNGQEKRVTSSGCQSAVTFNTPPPEHKNPTAEIFFGEHAVDLYGTMPVFGRVKAFDGAIATLGSPVVTPNDLGMISNWRTVSTERDGVTSCESGWICYQGTFRVTKDGTPGTYVYGTMVATATDNQDGEFTTQPKQFSVYYADHPDM